MIKSFILGMLEFRFSVTSQASDMLAYDWGREIMHRLTLRKFEQHKAEGPPQKGART